MKTKKIGAGTSFNITIPIEEPIENFSNVLLAVYTDEKRAVKFSYVEKAGFTKINVGSTTMELETVLTSEQTDKMQGCLFAEMKFLKGTDIGNSIPTPILDEFGYQLELIPTAL